MKKLKPPLVNDLAILKKIKNDTSFASHSDVLPVYKEMRKKYINYKINKGCPWLCTGDEVTKVVKNKFEAHFNQPRKELSYIADIREKNCPDVCPMCGSLGTGTVDHYLPQADYPEWIIYSKNLIPACDCNSKRQNLVKGKTKYQAVIHPYFDDGLEERLIYVDFSGDLMMPNFEIRPLPSSILHEDKIKFHIDSVVNKSRAIKWFENRWEKLKRNPRSVITKIPNECPVLTFLEFEEHLLQNLSDEDNNLGTPNNWLSMFLFGIHNSNSTKLWVFNRYNDIVQGNIDPLG